MATSFFRGAAANLIAKVALVLLGLGITVVVARRGAAVQGAFALFVACESVLLTLFSGFGLALAREVSHHRADAARSLSALLLASLGVGLLASGVLLGVAQVMGREPYRHLWLLALGAPFLLMVPTATGLWMGQGRMLPLNLAQVAAPASVLVGLLVGSVMLGGGFGAVAEAASAPGLTVMAVLTAWVVGKSIVGLSSAGWAFHDAGRARPDWTLLGRDARFIVVIGLTNVVSLLNYRVTLFVIEHFKGLADAGVYSVAMQVGELLWMVSSAVTVSAYHRIGDPDTRAAAAMTVRAVRINVLATVACAPVLLALAWWALPWALGQAYFEARWPLAALLPGIAGYAAASSLSAFYTNHLGRPHLSAAVAGLSLTLNVCVSLWAVPRWGALGAAASTSVAYLVAIVVACGIFLKHAGLGWSVWWRRAGADNTRLDSDSTAPGRTHA
ncbi:polysaccharide biosynthesis C-terminal domain-containing protein [Aquabacterium sp.]|uniref:polysaccharide biosynthesis C-terminal domain-containing protein n=1 Tax=Aquabacterium sp. TaxID=1872578 RepID=UPI0035B4135A